ncbi:MAG: DUF3822 family protein [Apibacter sp.]|nr:DUF3822 family protein [Apibacter sp.]
MKKSKRLHTHNQTLSTTLNFLFEDKKASYIVNNEKKIIHYESILTQGDKETIQNKLLKNNFFNTKCNFLDLTLLNDKFTLIPHEFFEERTAEMFLNLNVPHLENMGIRFNLIPNFDLVLVFYYPEIIEALFTSFSDKIRISHTGFKFLSKINKDLYKNGYFIQIYDNYFEISIIEEEKLILYNIYPYKIVDDIEYFLKLISTTLDKKLSMYNLYYYNIPHRVKSLKRFEKLFHDVIFGVENVFERENYTILDI